MSEAGRNHIQYSLHIFPPLRELITCMRKLLTAGGFVKDSHSLEDVRM